AYQIETSPAKLAQIEDAAKANNYSLLNREARRATAEVPETGYTEERGPSLTQEDAAMLRRLGMDPATATAEDIAAAREIALDEATTPERPPATATQPAAAAAAPATPQPAKVETTPKGGDISTGAPGAQTPPAAPTGVSADIAAQLRDAGVESGTFTPE